jgi:hypothetical protein
MTDLERLYCKLALLKIDKVTVSFSGSGDSGQVDDVSFQDHAGQDIDCTKVELEWDTQRDVFRAGKYETWETKHERRLVLLPDIIEKLFYEADRIQGLDWHNNDGGSGEFVIDLTTSPLSAKLITHINVVHTETYEQDFSVFANEEYDDASAPSQSDVG